MCEVTNSVSFTMFTKLGSHIWNIPLLLSITGAFWLWLLLFPCRFYIFLALMAAMSAQLYLKLYQRYPIMRGHLQGISKSSLKYNLGLKLSKQNLIPEANSFVTLRGLGVRGRGKRENCCEGEQKSALWGSEETTFKELTIPNIEENMCVDLNLTDNFPFESQFLLKFTLSVKCLPFKWNRVLIFEGLLFTVSTNFVHN